MKHASPPKFAPISRAQDDRLISSVRWSASAALIAAVHVGAVWWALHHGPAAGAPGLPDQLIMIEMEPIAVATQAAPDVPPPMPDVQDPQPEPTPTEEAPPPEPEPEVEPEPPVEDPPPPEPPAEPEAEPPPPEPPVTPPPPPTPAVEAEAVLPPPKPVKRKVVERKPKPVAARRPETRPPPPSPRRAQAAPAQGATAVSPAARANWHARVSAHLNRYKRSAPGGSTGVARVSFRLNASGHVTSASIVAGSGNSALDQEALALVRRANPLPAPPPEMGSSVSLTVPVRFKQ